ncbi:MAG TPA: DUF1194 domain-containing protein [Paracoccaceae bacterium]|nr:DUF1194 domain-containing protein [Paracoccaceae bacterium]HMO71739.1 DUF1194 domain-containing protein [Paracoccaceae bacterium]
MIRAAAALFALLPAPAWACRLALVLALDVSASVDAAEYGLMMHGTAGALVSDPVAGLILAPGAGEVALAAFAWSGPGEVSEVLGWTLLADRAALDRAAAAIAAAPRPAFSGRTATGSALAAGAAMLASGPPCARQVIDIATDDAANAGPDPARVRDSPRLADATVNALAVGGDVPFDHGSRAEEGGRLSAWLSAHVIRGPGAFVQGADDFRDFEAAMQAKLLREIAPVVVGRATTAQSGGSTAIMVP